HSAVLSVLFDIERPIEDIPRVVWFTPGADHARAMRNMLLSQVLGAEYSVKHRYELRLKQLENSMRTDFKVVDPALCALPLIVLDPISSGRTRAFVLSEDEVSGVLQVLELSPMVVSLWRTTAGTS